MRLFSFNKIKNMEQELTKIANNYLNFLKKKRNNIHFSNGEEDLVYDHFIKRINYAYEKLPLFRRKIINNDFFYNDYPFWWEKYCSKDFYLEERKLAIRQFLKEFEQYD